MAVSMPCSIVAVHPEDEAAVDHHAEVVQAANRCGVVAAHVLVLALLDEVVRVERLEPDKQASQSRIHGTLEKACSEHRVHGPGGLPETAHATHAIQQRRREAAIAEQVGVEEIQMTAGQALDLRQRRLDGLRILGAGRMLSNIGLLKKLAMS